MGFFSRIPLWVFLLNVGHVEGYYSELVVSSSDTDYLFHALRGFVGKSNAADVPDLAEYSRNMISTGINYGKTCSYWKDFHYMAFTGELFFFRGNCTYNFAYHCKNPPEAFSIQFRHFVDNQTVLYTKISLRINAIVVELNKDNVTVDGIVRTLPYSRPVFTIQKINNYLKIVSPIGLAFLKSDDGRFELQLDGKYANQTCGLCGDPTQSSIFENKNIPHAEITHGNAQKVEGPNEDCPDVVPYEISCPHENNVKCENQLRHENFSNCHERIAVDPFIHACALDLCQCTVQDSNSCMCPTISEYSHQCILQRGVPPNWRTSDLCPISCPQNMQYEECGSPCSNSCSDPERERSCDEHCIEGCFCQKGLIYDDISSQDCIEPQECPCTYNDKIYNAGRSYSTACRTCKCFYGKWKCTVNPCSATCSVEGGSHITTFDQLRYTVYGDCQYVIAKETTFIILGDLRKCGLRDTSVCLISVTILMGGTTLNIYSDGSVTVNDMPASLPVYTEYYLVFEPATNYYIFHANNIGMQAVIQIKPIMQLYVVVDPSFKNQTSGLCGDFNTIQRDDMKIISGVIEGTAPAFVNTWKVSALCRNIDYIFEDPCAINVESSEYANFWCGQISDPEGDFSPCHSTVEPLAYKKNCITDTCSCAKLEDCMCAAIFSYVKICAAKGVFLSKWKLSPCDKFLPICPENQVYGYTVSSCKPTCRSLNDNDATCNIHFDPLPDCTCKKGFYQNDNDKCVPVSACPCYMSGMAVQNDQTISENGALCTCTKGKLNCLKQSSKECAPPMVFADCGTSNIGAECAKSCHTLDMHCYSARCVPGCVCPPGLVSDEEGGCIPEDQCPCYHNTAAYNSGEEIQIRCNSCVCKNRTWTCTKNICLATCIVYGNGHYITFDGKRFVFNGECQYTLSQDHCSLSKDTSTFRIITQNVPCGNMGATCSKSIKVFLEDYELIFVDDHLNVAHSGSNAKVPYRVRLMGIYLVIETKKGLLIFWDKKSSIFIKVTSEYKGKLCGLCGTYDENRNNDFTTRNNAVVANTEEFGNSWRLSPTCADGKVYRDSCSLNPYRNAWAHKKCSIINSDVFSTCHPHVDPSNYFLACVSDSCACNTGGDCECFCTAVAAYAQSCGEYNICIAWRSPTICPLFCDYYNSKSGQDCEWHYKPCGAPCLKTCRNPLGKCYFEIRGLEGCYPKCPKDRPYFDEDEMKCVAVCGCYDMDRKHYHLGAIVPSRTNCDFCDCTMEGINCRYVVEECKCEYNGHMYKYNETIYNATDSGTGCQIAICKENGTIYFNQCFSSTIRPTSTTVLKTTTKIFTSQKSSTSIPTTRTASTPRITRLSTPCTPTCKWTEWYDEHRATPGRDLGGDFESHLAILKNGKDICYNPVQIECRAKDKQNKTLKELQQNVLCQVPEGLVCYNKNQVTNGGRCYNYMVRFLCCENICQFRTTELTTRNRTSYPITCTPKCEWTLWFNTHFPTFGKEGGEEENIQRIKQSGNKICDEAYDIICRAKDFPDISPDDLGQNVTCNLKEGFKCRNSEQPDGMCFDYEIRYLCCDDISHCETPTKISTVCRCTFKGSVYMPNTIISNITDKYGCTVITVCKEKCVIEEHQEGNCPASSTAMPARTPTTTPHKSPSTRHSATTISTSTHAATLTLLTARSTTSFKSTPSTTSKPSTTPFTTTSIPILPKSTSPTSILTASTTRFTTAPKTSPTSATSHITTTKPSTTKSASTSAPTPATTASTTHSTTSISANVTKSTLSTTHSITSPTSTNVTTLTPSKTITSAKSTPATTSTASTTHSTTSPRSISATTSTASTPHSTTSPISANITTSTRSTTHSVTSPASTPSTTSTLSTTRSITSPTSIYVTKTIPSKTYSIPSATSTPATTSRASTTSPISISAYRYTASTIHSTSSPIPANITTSTASTTHSTTSPISANITTSKGSTTYSVTSHTFTRSTTSTLSTTRSITSPTSTYVTTLTPSKTYSILSATSTPATTSTASTTSPRSISATTSTASTTHSTTTPISANITTSTRSTTYSVTYRTFTPATTSKVSTTYSITPPTSTTHFTTAPKTSPTSATSHITTTKPSTTKSASSSAPTPATTASTTHSTTSISANVTKSTLSTTHSITSPTSTNVTTLTPSKTYSITSAKSTPATTSTASTTHSTTSPRSISATTSTASTTHSTTSPISANITTSTRSTTHSVTSPASTLATTSKALTTQSITSSTSTHPTRSTPSTTQSTISSTSMHAFTSTLTTSQPTTSPTSTHATTLTPSTTSPTSINATTLRLLSTRSTTSPVSTLATTSATHSTIFSTSIYATSTPPSTQSRTSSTSTHATISTPLTSKSTTASTSTHTTTSTPSTRHPTTKSTPYLTTSSLFTTPTTIKTSTIASTSPFTSTIPTTVTRHSTTPSTAKQSTMATTISTSTKKQTATTKPTTGTAPTTTAEGCPPRKPGEYWIQGCKNCTCDHMSLKVICVPVTCPSPEIPRCVKKGFILANVPDPSNPCCMKKECLCNVFSCSPANMTCMNPGEELISTLKEGDCCPSHICVIKPCVKYNMSSIIEHQNCTSSGPVELTYCEGGCISSSRLSFQSDMMEEKCTCCRPFKTTNRTVELTCLDGTTTSHSYIYVDECSCSIPECEHLTPTTVLPGIV